MIPTSSEGEECIIYWILLIVHFNFLFLGVNERSEETYLGHDEFFWFFQDGVKLVHAQMWFFTVLKCDLKIFYWSSFLK